MRVARDKAESASKAKSAFLNMVSHELRTPLTQLELQLAVLRRRFRSVLDEEQRDIMSGSTAALHRLAGLVGSVLDYSRGFPCCQPPDKAAHSQLISRLWKGRDDDLAARGR